MARIPKQSQMDLAPAANLVHQAAGLERAARSGHTPALLGVLPPSAALPRGALIVEAISGRAARWPHDMTAIMTALARIHRLPLPAQDARAPLALIAHVRGRVDHDLSAPTVERVLDEIVALGQTLPTTACQDAVLVGRRM
jgi:hypothetical protein